MDQFEISLYIDPPSHHFLNDKLFEIDQARLAGDNLMAPYAHLRSYLETKGIRVHTADKMPALSNRGRNIFVSLGRRGSYKSLANRSDTILSAFFAMECPIVDPVLYRELPEVQRYFRRVFSWSDTTSLERFTGSPVQLRKFHWPQSFDDVHEKLWCRQDRKFMVMINSNKLPRLYWRELYTERLRAIEYFEQTGEIDLYGRGWDKPSTRLGRTNIPYTFRFLHQKLESLWHRFRPNPQLEAARRVYQGTTPSKSETLSQYHFALCFENMILKGWITEKIFDCFFTGTVPIYWGEPEIETIIPSSCFIDMRDFKGYEDLGRFLRSLTFEQIQQYKESAREFLNSPQFHPFSKDAFTARFCGFLEEDLGVNIRGNNEASD